MSMWTFQIFKWRHLIGLFRGLKLRCYKQWTWNLELLKASTAVRHVLEQRQLRLFVAHFSCMVSNFGQFFIMIFQLIRFGRQ